MDGRASLSHMSKLALQLLEGALRPSPAGTDRILSQIGSRTKPWLRPLAPSLEAAGGTLLRTLNAPGGVSGEGDAGQRAWFVTPDGCRLVAGCRDRRIRMWDLTSGDLLLTGVGCIRPATRHRAVGRRGRVRNVDGRGA